MERNREGEGSLRTRFGLRVLVGTVGVLHTARIPKVSLCPLFFLIDAVCVLRLVMILLHAA